MEPSMQKTTENSRNRVQLNFMDALMYLVAGSAMTIISVSFLLWLQF